MDEQMPVWSIPKFNLMLATNLTRDITVARKKNIFSTQEIGFWPFFKGAAWAIERYLSHTQEDLDSALASEKH